MAFCARHGNVFSDERILRRRVIEINPLPPFGKMAFIASLSQRPFVSIVLSVAFKACFGRLSHLLRLVAFQTVHLLMETDQFEPGLIVVECGLFPRLGRMAGLTPLAENAFVLVVFAMAADAGGGDG